MNEPTTTIELVEAAINRSGSTRALAAAVGVALETVRRWRRTGEVGPEGVDQLRALLGLEVAAPAEGEWGDVAAAVDAAAAVVGGYRALARELEVDAATVRRWRSGDCAPPAGALRRILEAEGPAGSNLEPESAAPPEMIEVEAGAELPSGKVYAPAAIPLEQVGDLPPVGPEGLAELQAWADLSRPAWLCRAAARAKGVGSLATWLGTVRRPGGVEVDQDLALARALEVQEMSPPLYARRILGETCRLLAKRGAKIAAPKKRSRAAIEQASARLAAHPIAQALISELGARPVSR